MSIFFSIYNKLFKYRKKEVIIKNYNKYCRKNLKIKKKALIYYKSDIFQKNYFEKYQHTNNWEILEITKILNELGFYVDIIDRDIDVNFMPEDKYDLFIGNASGNSGKYYAKYANKLSRAIKVFYATGADPKIRNGLIRKRYEYLKTRKSIEYKLIPRRIKKNCNTELAMNHTDYVFAIGNKFAVGTYEKYNIPIYKIYPSSSPRLIFCLECIKNKSTKKFLYFGGNGNIVKGLDILIEVFSQLPKLELYICAPSDEEEFNEIYKELLENNPNIYNVGFIEVGGEKFNSLTEQCGFIVLPSCSEGIATSVATCMRRGLIPIVTYESGINVCNFGFLINDLSIQAIKNQIQAISKISKEDFKRKIVDTYIESFKYTQQNFSRSFKRAILDVLLKNNKI